MIHNDITDDELRSFLSSTTRIQYGEDLWIRFDWCAVEILRLRQLIRELEARAAPAKAGQSREWTDKDLEVSS